MLRRRRSRRKRSLRIRARAVSSLRRDRERAEGARFVGVGIHCPNLGHLVSYLNPCPALDEKRPYAGSRHAGLPRSSPKHLKALRARRTSPSSREARSSDPSAISRAHISRARLGRVRSFALDGNPSPLLVPGSG